MDRPHDALGIGVAHAVEDGRERLPVHVDALQRVEVDYGSPFLSQW